VYIFSRFMLSQLAQAEEDVTALVLRHASELPRISSEVLKHQQQVAGVEQWLEEYEKMMGKQQQQVR
jgi:hypothetical protein